MVNKLFSEMKSSIGLKSYKTNCQNEPKKWGYCPWSIACLDGNRFSFDVISNLLLIESQPQVRFWFCKRLWALWFFSNRIHFKWLKSDNSKYQKSIFPFIKNIKFGWFFEGSYLGNQRSSNDSVFCSMCG